MEKRNKEQKVGKEEEKEKEEEDEVVKEEQEEMNTKKFTRRAKIRITIKR